MRISESLKVTLGIFLGIFLNLLVYAESRAAVIDVMIVYDTKAQTWVQNNGGMTAFSLDAVSRMNQALENSGLSHSFRLVHSMGVAYETQSFGSDLNALQSGSGAFANVHSARSTYGADLVAMMVDTGSAYGVVGMGYVLSSWQGNKSSGFCVNAVRSVEISHTLTHEVGHNLGGAHAKNQASSPGPNSFLDNQYSAGYYFNGTDNKAYHTIMAYGNDGYSNNYWPAPLFSNPLKTYQGTPAGDASDADHVRLFNQTMPTVSNYFDSVDPPTKTLENITISGPTSINEGASGTYSAEARWSDGSRTIVTPNWSENSSYTSISSSGVLQASSVSSDQSVTVSASYTSGGVTRSDTHGVTIRNVAATLESLTISGAESVNEGASTSYSAEARWSDGSRTPVSPSWSENSSYASISTSGVLQASSVSSDQTVIVSASYSSGGVTRSDTFSVTIKNVAATLESLTISGPTIINEGTSATYSAEAHWSDGSRSSITPNWSENSSSTTINSSGVLQASSVDSDQTVTVSASYAAGGVTRTDTHSVVVKNVFATLESLSIDGPSNVYEQSATAFRAVARWSDGSSGVVEAAWAENSPYAVIDSTGTLTTFSVSSTQGVRLSATYTLGGIEKSAVRSIDIFSFDGLGDVLDNNMIWRTGGVRGWFEQTQMARQTSTAMQSGAIGANQQSFLETFVRGSGTISFFWSVSSEKNGDFLRLYIDGKESRTVKAISGDVGWRVETIKLPPGDHSLRWIYVKNATGDAGKDAGWLDQVTWVSDGEGDFPWPLFFNTIMK